jgi:hypothetical protein
MSGRGNQEHFLEQRLDLTLVRGRQRGREELSVELLRDLDDLRSELVPGSRQGDPHRPPIVRIRRPLHPAARLDAMEDSGDALRLLEQKGRGGAWLDRRVRVVEHGE